jgi:hypothetical protein
MPNSETTPVHPTNHAVTLPSELPAGGHATSHIVAPPASGAEPLTPDLPAAVAAPVLSPTVPAAGSTHTSDSEPREHP